MKSKPIILVIILVSWMAKAEAATYYVAMSGSNSNSGSIDSPWQTITYAVGSSSGVQPGDTILVRAGNYPETVNPGVSGIPGSPIVLMNYPGENVTLDPGRLRIDNGDDYWKFDGLRISNSSSNGLYVSGTHPNGFLTVSNCEFVSCSNNGIELGGPDFGGITIEDCLIELNGTVTEGHGIIMYGGVGVVWLHRNWIINNEGKGITHATEADWEADSSVIDSNYIINNLASGIDWWGDNSYITNNYISWNGVRDPEDDEWGDKGFAMDNYASGNLVAYNVIKSSGRWELEVRGENNEIYNNTLIKDHYYDLVPGSPGAATLVFWAGVGSGNEFKNNIFVNYVSQDYHHYAILAEQVARYTDNFWSNNLYMCTFLPPNQISPSNYTVSRVVIHM